MLGLNGVAVTSLTMAKIRKVYSKVDTKSIAKQLGGMATGENATPIRVVHNAAGLEHEYFLQKTVSPHVSISLLVRLRTGLQNAITSRSRVPNSNYGTFRIHSL